VVHSIHCSHWHQSFTRSFRKERGFCMFGPPAPAVWPQSVWTSSLWIFRAPKGCGIGCTNRVIAYFRELGSKTLLPGSALEYIESSCTLLCIQGREGGGVPFEVSQSQDTHTPSCGQSVGTEAAGNPLPCTCMLLRTVEASYTTQGLGAAAVLKG